MSEPKLVCRHCGQGEWEDDAAAALGCTNFETERRVGERRVREGNGLDWWNAPSGIWKVRVTDRRTDKGEAR